MDITLQDIETTIYRLTWQIVDDQTFKKLSYLVSDKIFNIEIFDDGKYQCVWTGTGKEGALARYNSIVKTEDKDK